MNQNKESCNCHKECNNWSKPEVIAIIPKEKMEAIVQRYINILQ